MGTLTLHKNKSGEDCNFVENKFESPLSEKKGHAGQTIFFENPPNISGRMAVVGNREGEGPLGKYFQKVDDDIKEGKKNYELAEIKMLEDAIRGAIQNAGLMPSDIDLLLSGDLLNQITSSNYCARNLKIPFLGMFSACSTMTECLAIGASMISAGYFDNVACSTSSHFATAERQFRYPLEYGCQRPPYAQWTVTGAGCSVLSKRNPDNGIWPSVTMATFGRVVDFGTNDLNNMGASMAPAAMDTLASHFKSTGTRPADYDFIATGDLGKLGSDILRDLMREKGYALEQNYADCGGMIYGIDQNCYQGGSGCACSATVFNSFILEKMHEKRYNKVLYAATGALMSPQSCFQGETIPCISHAVVIENL